MGMSLVFTSGKGGTGKSTAVSTIASCMAALGQRVLCMDLDLRLPNLDLLLGMSDLTTLDIADVAAGRNTLEEAVVEHPTMDGLFLLAGPALCTEALNGETLARIVDEAREQYDYCLIDGPAGLDEMFYLTAKDADAVVVVATTDATSQRDAQRAVMELDEMGIDNLRLLLNRVRVKMITKSAINVDDIIDFVGVQLLGIVPEDQDVIEAASRLRPLVLYSRRWASSAFLRIAKRIMGMEVPLKHR
ncbi:MAG: AAA family ATPase [Oscillospiraceae bacterium]|nr:AAA family ATPase [Oscillospiraceae bacterium]